MTLVELQDKEALKIEMDSKKNECAAIPTPGEPGLIQLMGKISDTTAKAMSICQMIDANLFNGAYQKKEPKEIKRFRDVMYEHLIQVEALRGQLESIARNLGLANALPAAMSLHPGMGTVQLHVTAPTAAAKWIWRTKQMTIDRAIEILNPEHREHYDGMDEVNEACRMGMEALERIRWIPCSERLPELQDTRWVRTVIVCARGHVMPMIYERDIVQGKAVGLWKWMWREIFNEPEAITHWMPLPEPPVKEGT